jgi:PAS domain-containing protein
MFDHRHARGHKEPPGKKSGQGLRTMKDQSRGRQAAGLSTEWLELLGDIYQAGLEPERWPDTLARMSRMFAADLACIYTPFPARPEQALYLTHNFTREMEQAYSAYYHHLDEWTRHALRQQRYIQGSVALGEEIVPQAELRRTEYYNDFLKPHDMEWMVTTALLDGRTEGSATHMSFTRHRGRDAYDGEGKRLIELLAPHVRRALLTHWRLTEARLGADAQEAALAHMGYGVMLMEAGGAVLYLNPVAEALLAPEDGLALRAGRLRALHDDDALAGLVRQAGLGVGGGLCVRRTPDGDGQAARCPTMFSATPVRAESARWFPTARFRREPCCWCATRIAGPARKTCAASPRAATSAPPNCVSWNCCCAAWPPRRSPPASNLGVRTVRSQLSSLYAKTGTRNQRELVALALREGLVRA